MHVHVYTGTSKLIGIGDGEWKALSVSFTKGAWSPAPEIESVTMHHGSPGQLTTQSAGSFFQAAELGGAGLAWPNGLAATVTFAAGTDMDAVQIDYASLNTYVVAYEDPTCVPVLQQPCATLPAVYFSSSARQPAVVAFSAASDLLAPPGSASYDVYVFAPAAEFKQVSVGFNAPGSVQSWSFETSSPMQIIQGSEAFGIWRSDGGFLPTGVALTRLTAPADGCVTACIDPSHPNSNAEDTTEVSNFYDVVYVHGADVTPYDPCTSCTYVFGGGDPAECTSSAGASCAANGQTCLAGPPCVCGRASHAPPVSMPMPMPMPISMCTCSCLQQCPCPCVHVRVHVHVHVCVHMDMDMDMDTDMDMGAPS